MEHILESLTKIEIKNKQFYNKLKKQINKYEKENTQLKVKFKILQEKYLQETEIIVKLDQKIYDLREENNKLKETIESFNK